MRILPPLAAVAWIAFGAHAAPPARNNDSPGSHDCGLAEIRIHSSDARDAQDACSAGSLVYAFFRDLGIAAPAPLTLSVVERLPAGFDERVLGYFAHEDRHIRILSFAAAKQRGTWLDRPLDRALYRSIPVHELAHALAWSNASDRPLSVRAREYIAYIVMFATMDPVHRDAILAATPGSGLESESQLSLTSCYLAPYSFGVDAYRHYLRPENGPRFVRAILRGEALPALED